MTAAPSGLFKAGSILVLVGAILAVVAAVLFVVAGAVMLSLGANLIGGESEATLPLSVIGTIYIVLGAMAAVGCVFGFRSYRATKRGDVHAAWINGLVCSLLPPLQVVPLVGAILLLVSPEHEAAKRGAMS